MLAYNTALKVLKTILVAFSGYYIIVFVVVALMRVNFPFELEWMEGGMLESVRWIMNGNDLYIKPSMEFIPFMYKPLFYWIAAGLANITGLEFYTLRIISIASIFFSFILIANIVKKETGSLVAGVTSVGFFAATYQLSGQWFDLARVDSLFLLLMLSTIAILQRKESVWNLVIASLFSVLAFLTKQSALGFILILSVYLVFKNPKINWIYMLVSLGSVIIISLVFNGMSEGWYYYYVFELPSQHKLLPSELSRFWQRDIVHPFWIVILMSIVPVYLLLKKNANQLLYIMAIVAFFGISWFSRLHDGGYNNVLIPAYAGMAVLVGLIIGKSNDWMKLAKINHIKWSGLVLIGMMIVQLALLYYSPGQCIGRETNKHNWEEMVARIQKSNGEVFVPHHGYLAVISGKSSYAHSMAVLDILKGKDLELKTELLDELGGMIDERRFEAIIYDSNRDLYMSKFEKLLNVNYGEIERINTQDANSSWLVTGMQTKPNIIRTPR